MKYVNKINGFTVESKIKLSGVWEEYKEEKAKPIKEEKAKPKDANDG